MCDPPYTPRRGRVCSPMRMPARRQQEGAGEAPAVGGWAKGGHMTLRDKRAVSDLLHGRWSDSSVYAYIRLNGDGYEGERQRIHQPVDLMELQNGLWLPIAMDEQPELRVYSTGLGDMRDIVFDHPGGVGSTIYRIGARKRHYTDRKTGKKVQAYELCITDRMDMAQRSLPPPTQVQTPAPGAPPTGGVPNSHTAVQGCAQQHPPAPAGPISPPSAQPVCPECGQPATRFKDMWVHCGREVRA